MRWRSASLQTFILHPSGCSEAIGDNTGMIFALVLSASKRWVENVGAFAQGVVVEQ